MSSSAARARFLLLAAWSTVGLLLPGLVVYLQLAHSAIRSPLELDYGEGTVLWQARALPRLDQAVHPFGTYPYILFNYTPIYQCALRFVASTGLSLQTAGRLVSVLSFLGTLVLVAKIVKRASSARLALPCALAGGLLVANLPSSWWSALVRVDSLAVFVVVLGLALFLIAAGRETRREILTYAAFAIFVGALYTRQTLIAAPSACLVYLWLFDRRSAVRHAIVFATTGTAILILLGALTHGEWPRHLFRYNVSPQAWRHGLWLMLDQYEKSAPILLLAVIEALTAVWVFLRRRGRSRSAHEQIALLFAIYFAMTALCSLSIVKDGANVNYLLEFLIAGCVLAAMGVLRLLSNAIEGNPRQVWPALGSLFVLSSMTAFVCFAPPSLRIPATDSELAKAHNRLLARLAGLRGEVFSEEMTALIQAGKEVPVEPASASFLSRMHLWDERPLIAQIDDGRFAAIVVTTSLENRGRFSSRVSAAITKWYRLQEEIGPYHLYLPITDTKQIQPDRTRPNQWPESMRSASSQTLPQHWPAQPVTKEKQP